jgi:hypothetical protein
MRALGLEAGDERSLIDPSGYGVVARRSREHLVIRPLFTLAGSS